MNSIKAEFPRIMKSSLVSSLTFTLILMILLVLRSLLDDTSYLLILIIYSVAIINFPAFVVTTLIYGAILTLLNKLTSGRLTRNVVFSIVLGLLGLIVTLLEYVDILPDGLSISTLFIVIFFSLIHGMFGDIKTSKPLIFVSLVTLILYTIIVWWLLSL